MAVNSCVSGISSWVRGHRGSLAGSNVYCARTDSVDSCPKTEPQEQRCLTLYILASKLQKQKARSNPYMAIYNFIGYFTLVLHDFPPPSATWPPPRSDSSGFISLQCHPYLPTTLSELRSSLFSSGPPPCYRITGVSHWCPTFYFFLSYYYCTGGMLWFLQKCLQYLS
jgi:hypothetical protein